jgi:hypothetical protein
MVLDDLDHGVEQETSKNLMPSPYLAHQMLERKFSSRVAERARPKS